MVIQEIAGIAIVYVVIGAIFSVRYACTTVMTYNEMWDDDDEIIGSMFFYKLFGNWCKRNNVDYGFLMFMYSIFFWPTYLLTMSFSLIRGIAMLIYALGSWFIGNSINFAVGVKNSFKQ